MKRIKRFNENFEDCKEFMRWLIYFLNMSH